MRGPPLPSVPLPRAGIRVAVACAALLGLLALGWLWLRDSPLVAVERVTVTGATGPDARRVRTALDQAARDMTTLHVRQGALRTAVRPFGRVASVRASPDFPHTLRIEVREHVAVGALGVGGERVAVAADGTVLRDAGTSGLPLLSARSAPAGERVTDRTLAGEVALLAAAPRALRSRVIRVGVGTRGLTAPLRDGPALLFGGPERLRAKWVAVTRVLADPTSAGAEYLDVRVPERPAAGGLAPLSITQGATSPSTTP
jgi:cell division protein FtsQ